MAMDRYEADAGDGYIFRKLVFPADDDLLIDIHRIYDAEYGFPHEEEKYRTFAMYLRRHADINHPFVLTGKNQVTGYIRSYDRLSASSCGIVLMLDLVYILPGFRGCGLGARMMEAFMTFARRRGASRIDLLTDMDNPAAVKLYEKYGFKGRHRFQMICFLKDQPALTAYLKKKRSKNGDGEA